MAKDGAKQVKAIIDALEADPRFEVGRTKSGHYVVRTAAGEWVANLPSTPGNDARRSVLNDLARLKRAGFAWPVPKGKGQRGK